MSTRRLDVTGRFAPKKFGRLNSLTSLERETNEHSQDAESADKLTGKDDSPELRHGSHLCEMF